MKQQLKKLKETVFLLPAICIAVAAIIGFSCSKPSFDEIEFPGEIPEVQAAVTEEEADASNAEELTTGTYTDGEYTGIGGGYSGDTKVKVIVENGKITSVEILSTVDDAAFMKRASRLADTIAEKQTWEVDAVSEATYSSRGICEAVRNALTGSTEKSDPVKKATTSGSTSSASYTADGSWKDGTFTGSAKGYGGTISVSVTIKNKKIMDIKVTSHSGETGAYYNRAKAIIKKMLQKQSPNVDTISGATYSSKGIKNAVIIALKRAEGKTVKDATGSAKKSSKKKKIADDSSSKIKGTPKDGTYHVSAKCSPNSRKEFTAYTMSCDVTFKNGKLVSMKNFKCTGSSDNAKYYNKAIKGKNSVVSQLIKKQSTSSISAVSDATCSSIAVKNLYLKALQKATGKTQTDTSNMSSNTNTSTNSTDNKGNTDTEKQTADGLKDGTYTGSAPGYGVIKKELLDKPIKVSVTVKDGKITAIEVTDKSGETDAFYNRAVAVIDSIIAAQSTDVDDVSGATYTSKGIKNAVANALKAAKSDASDDTDSGDSGDSGKTEETGGDSGKTEETGGDSSKTEETGGDSSKTEETEGDSSKTEETESETITKTYSAEVSSDNSRFTTYKLSCEVTVKVTTKDGDKSATVTKISSMNMDVADSVSDEEYLEDEDYSKSAFDKVNRQLPVSSSGSIDNCSGATRSTNAIKSIIEKALENALK